MGTKDNKLMRTLVALGSLTAAMLAHETLTYNAHAFEDVEEYANEGKSNNSEDDAESEDYGRIDVRLTRPGEAEGRYSDDGYAQVPGAERLRGKDEQYALKVPKSNGSGMSAFDSIAKSENDLIIPGKRGIASVTPGNTTAQPVSIMDIPEQGAAAQPAQRTVVASVGSTENTSARYEAVREEPRPVKPGVYQEVSMIVSDHGFFPSRIFVTQNIPVKMYLTTPSKSTLCFMVDVWGVKKGIAPGKVEEVSFTPDRAGNYRYYCPVKGIEGMITVREAPAPVESARSVASLIPFFGGSSDSNQEEPVEKAKFNEPKNANRLRAVIDEE